MPDHPSSHSMEEPHSRPDTHSSPSQEILCESASSLLNSLTWEEVHGQHVLPSLHKDPNRDNTAGSVSHLPNIHHSNPSGQLSANLQYSTVSSQEISKLCDVPYGALAGGDHPGRNPQEEQNIPVPVEIMQLPPHQARRR